MRTVLRLVGIFSTVVLLAIVGLGAYLFIQYRPVLEDAYERVRTLPGRISEERERLPGVGDAAEVLERTRDAVPDR